LTFAYWAVLERQINMNKLNIKEYKTKSGEVRYILHGAYIGTDVLTGKQVRTDVRGRTKKDVKTKLQRLQNDFIKNGCMKKEKQLKTFAEVAESWFDMYQHTVKSHSIEIMRSNLKRYILPAFGDIKLDRLTTSQIQLQVNRWAKNASQPLNGAMRRNKGNAKGYKLLLNVTNRIFKYAISMGLVSSNPCLTVIVPNVKMEITEREVKHFNKEQLQAYFDYMESLPNTWVNNELRSICRLLTASGLRIGEATALSWSDIDFEKQTISVSKTTTGHQTIQDTPKTKHSKRVVIIDSMATSHLQRWHLYQKSYFLKLGQPNQSLIFPTNQGRILDYQRLRKSLQATFEATKLHDIGFHGFRHSHASLLLNAGVSYKEIQTRLGHASIKMTMDIYSHLEKEKESEAVELFAKYANF
jgi:Site-specific recombinase XerD